MKILHPLKTSIEERNAMKKIHTLCTAAAVALTLSLFSFGCAEHNSMDTMSSKPMDTMSSKPMDTMPKKSDTMQNTQDSMKGDGMKNTMPDTMKSNYIGGERFVNPGNVGGM